MSKPEQELLAKYLLQQLISRDSDPELDPVVARLASSGAPAPSCTASVRAGPALPPGQ